MSKQPPCYKCQDREFGCHSVCNKYKEFDSANKKIQKARREEYFKNHDLDCVEYGSQFNYLRKRRRKK